MTRFHKLVLASAIATLAVIATAASASGSAARSAQALQFLSVQQHETLVPRVGPSAPVPIGGRLIFTDTIYNHAAQFGKPSGTRVGKSEGVCTIVAEGTAQCTITAHLPNGDFIAIGAIALQQKPTTNTSAIVGGTGAYATTHGSATTTPLSHKQTLLVLHLHA